MTDPTESHTTTTPDTEVIEPLTSEEDDELRRLNYMAQHGWPARRTIERILELRLRDRRKEIRPPREFEAEPPAEVPPWWIMFRRR